MLHNRGALFTAQSEEPERPRTAQAAVQHAVRGFAMRGGEPLMTVTLMGGDMQAQGHAQLLVNILDLGANLQAAADMARFRHSQVANVLNLETPLYELVGRNWRPWA